MKKACVSEHSLSLLAGDDVREYYLNNVKKLSPTEPVVTVDFAIEAFKNYSVTKLEKLIRTKYGFSTRLNPPIVKFTATIELTRFSELLNKLRELINELMIENPGINLCVNYKVVVYNTECLCRENVLNYVNLGNRVFCISKINERYIYLYCNKNKNYVTIKYFVHKPVSIPDPLQLTPSVFTHCSSLDKVLDYLVEVKYNLELVKKYINR